VSPDEKAEWVASFATVIDEYVHENYGYLEGTKEVGYQIDGYIGPVDLAERLTTVVEELL